MATGLTKVDDFDFKALRFDFGSAGLCALDRLAREGRTPAIRQLAAKAQARTDRFDHILARRLKPDEIVAAALFLQVLPRRVPVPRALRDALFADGEVQQLDCKPQGGCLLFWQPGQDVAVFVVDGCAAFSPAERVDPAVRCATDVDAFVLRSGRWQVANGFVVEPSAKMSPAQERAALTLERRAIARGEIEIRTVPRRQVFVGGKPTGAPFE